MKSLFSDNRLANMLHLFQNMQSVTVKTLASKLGVSDRTIRNDIKSLNQTLAGCALIEGRKGRYSLEVLDGQRFNAILSEMAEADDLLNSPRNRMDYLFGKLMRADRPLLTDDLAYEMSVGRTTLVNDLRRLRQELEAYHIRVEGKTSQGLTLYGNESDIRRYVLDTNFESIYHSYPLDREVEGLLRQYFGEQMLDPSVQHNFRRFVILMLDRFLTGHYIGKLSAEAYDLVARAEFAAVNDVVGRIGESLGVTLPAEEKLFALMPIIGMRTPADIRGMRSIELDESVRPLLPKIVRRIHEDLNLHISLGDYTEEFLYHLMFMINRLRFGIRQTNPMAEDMREKYPLAYQVAGIASDVIARECSLEVTEDEQAYLATYFGVFLTESQLRMERRFRIAAVYTTGRVTARLLEMQLQRIVGGGTELTMLPEQEATTENLDEFDLVLTTVELKQGCHRPVIQISEIVREQELRRMIDRARYYDQVNTPTLDGGSFVMTGLFGEEQFFRFEQGVTYEQGLRCMVSKLGEDGLVDGGFAERLDRRVEQGSMTFGNAIALPHVIQYASDHIVLAVGVFARPVRYGSDEVSIVFLLGLPEHIEENDYLLIRVYDEVIAISQNDELRERIVAARDYQQLRRALFRHAE